MTAFFIIQRCKPMEPLVAAWQELKAVPLLPMQALLTLLQETKGFIWKPLAKGMSSSYSKPATAWPLDRGAAWAYTCGSNK